MKQAHKAIFGVLFLALTYGLRLAAEEHPVPLTKDTDCASCHDDKTKGKAVHSAIAMGCTTCHEIKTEGDSTTVNLTAPKDQLCLTCHEKSKEETLHGPYDKGQCVTCHDPHTSDYPDQLRAEVNPLCMACHADRKNLADPVSLFGDQTMAKAQFDDIPKIAPNPTDTVGHPFFRHPMGGIPDPLNSGQKMSCLSCHEPHSSKQDQLIKIAKTNNGDICGACHEAVEAKQQDANEKKYGEIEDKNRKEVQERQKKVVNEQPATPSPKGPN
ncbi:MAG: cytochrome c3 family protein [Terriglobales bacterium]